MIEETLAALTAAITENTTVLREVLAAANVIPITESPKPAKKKAEKLTVVEPEPEAAEKLIEDASDKITAEKVAAVNAVAEKIVSERRITTPVTEPVAETTLDPEALITQITDLWKTQLTSADPERKVMLKDKFPELRAKWGLAPDDKLITLAPTPEKLAGLLADIKEL